MTDEKVIFDEEQIKEGIFNEPMTVENLRERLKHIACLCWGLSIDLNNDIELSGLFELENRQLRKKVAAYDKNVAQSERRLARMKESERRESNIKRLRRNKYVMEHRAKAEETRRQSNKNV